ncbi:hypothetical protein ACOZ4N_11690 [Halorientalis pallida]|uniref:hypothetical protein n=1 Tax=Halorientalis pallida TaxID=2479928 RepID=UPI003C6EAF2C
MSLERTNRLLVGVLLAVALFSVSSAAVAGTPATELAQTTDETTNDSTANATVGNLTVWTAPTGAFAELTSPAAIDEARREGRLTRVRPEPVTPNTPWSTRDNRSEVAVNDTVVFSVHVPGLAEAVAAANDTDSAAPVLPRVLNRSPYEFRMQQTWDTTRSHGRPKLLNLSATLAADGLGTVADDRDGTLYVVLRPDRAVLETESRDGVSLRDGQAYRVAVTAGTGDGATTVTAEWRAVERAVSYDTVVGGEIVARGGHRECAPVAGETSVAPGTDLRVDLYPTDPKYGWWSTYTTVDRSGRFFACVDTSKVPSNVSLNVSIEGVPDSNGVIVGGAYESTTLDAERTANGNVTVAGTIWTESFVALYAVPDDAIGLLERGQPPNCTGRGILSTVANWSRVGTSDRLQGGQQTVRLDPPTDAGTSGRLVAVVHPSRDRDDRLDFPGSDFPVCTAGTLEGSIVAPAAGNGSRPAKNATAVSTTERSPIPDGTHATATSSTTAANGPGFNPIAAVLALLVVALMTGRQR